MKYLFILFLLSLLLPPLESVAQINQLPGGRNASDTIHYYVHTGCKMIVPVRVELYAPRGDTHLTAIKRRLPQALQTVVKRTPFLRVHGSITYDGYYQSQTDTPYLERDIYQHTLQTNLDITVKDNYPLHMAFSTSMGNSVLFRNITGLNFQYNNRDFKRMLMERASTWDAGKLRQLKELDSLKGKLDLAWDEINCLKAWFTAPQQLQRMIEAKEHDYGMRARDTLFGLPQHWRLAPFRQPFSLSKMPRDSAGNAFRNDSAVARFRKEIAGKQQLLDSLQQQFTKQENVYHKKQKLYGSRKTSLLNALKSSKNDQELSSSLSDMNLPDSVLPKGYKLLLALRSAGIGRTMVDYSELTAKNISILGVQAELNPSWYLAVASGSVDYRFRDYIVNTNRARQYLNIVRAGFGKKEGNNVILSFYTGKKQVYNMNTTAPAGGTADAPDYRIMGISLEGKWQLNPNHYIIGEVAKSSLPYYARTLSHESAGSSMFRFNTHSNEAFSVSTFSFIPLTATRITGMYKLMGADFQSFSLYASGSEQRAWMVKVDQPFFKQQLTLTGSVRQNVYNSVFEYADYHSSTVFKSIQATFRRRNWPVISAGYFPSSQLMKLSEGPFVENLFYTLASTLSHSYQYRGIGMSTVFSGTKFYNRQTDSSFVYFNSTNLQLNQTLFLGRFTLNGGLSSSTNRDYALYGADGSVQCRINDWLELGAGLKYNYQTVYDAAQAGYNGNARIHLPKIGDISMMADKGFVPGVNRQLVSNKTGRLTYTRIF